MTRRARRSVGIPIEARDFYSHQHDSPPRLAPGIAGGGNEIRTVGPLEPRDLAMTEPARGFRRLPHRRHVNRTSSALILRAGPAGTYVRLLYSRVVLFKEGCGSSRKHRRPCAD